MELGIREDDGGDLHEPKLAVERVWSLKVFSDDGEERAAAAWPEKRSDTMHDSGQEKCKNERCDELTAIKVQRESFRGGV